MSGTDGAADAVAIIGMVGRFPGAGDIGQFWDNLVNGIESISHFTDDELEPSRLELPGTRSLEGYVMARGVLEDADKFDAAFFGIKPREAALMDPQHRVFLEASWAALESAGCDPGAYEGSIGVWAGMGNSTYYLENVLSRPDAIEQLGPFQAMLANEKDFLTTRVSHLLNLRGPSVNVYTACSTSLVAVVQASQALLGYQCDMALAGGVCVSVPQRRGYLYQEGAIGSPDGRCRPFDQAAAGTLFSDGLGIVVLKRLEEAVDDGDTIHAVIKGGAVNNDGSGKVSFAAPSVDGQAEVIAMAQAVAGVDPETISYVEAHGTGTPLGDPIEVEALTQAFRAQTDASGFCAIGSVKSNIGHLDPAAGVAGLIKTVLALRHRTLPPSLHFAAPNPRIDFASSPFFVNAELRPWENGSTPRRAGVSSFGIGGTNAHVVLEEAPPSEPTPQARSTQLLVLSAKTRSSLEAASVNLARHLRAEPRVQMGDVAWTLQTGRKRMAHRRAFVARDFAEAAATLEANDPERVLSGSGERSDAKVAFLFPGQGAQSVGMAGGLYRSEPVFAAELDACADALLPHLGLDIRSLIFPESSAREEVGQRLSETAQTQPALFAVECALARLWMAWGVAPAAMIGHSLGEYVAAYLAGVLSREAAAFLVATRGRLMQEQPRGAMLGVRIPAAELEPRLGPDVVIAGLNGPGVAVASGPTEAVRALEAELTDAGIECRLLATSHAFHSPMMDGALPPFREALGRVRLDPPHRPWISCLTGDWITPEQAVDPEYWVRQLRQPVRFSDGVQRVAGDPDVVFLEVGPGRTLSSLVRQHRDRPDGQAVVTSLGPEPERDVESLLEAAGRLWIAGVSVDWSGLHGGEPRRRVPLPTYPFERTRFWLEPAPLTAAPVRDVSPAPAMPAAAPGREELSRIDAPGHSGTAEPASTFTEMEAIIAGVWTDLLGLSSVDVHDNFFDLGGDSLLALRVVTAIEQQTGLRLPSQAILVQNLGQLAMSLEASVSPTSAPVDSAPEASADAPPLESRGLVAGLLQALKGFGLRPRGGGS